MHQFCKNFFVKFREFLSISTKKGIKTFCRTLLLTVPLAVQGSLHYTVIVTLPFLYNPLPFCNSDPTFFGAYLLLFTDRKYFIEKNSNKI